MYKMIKKLFIYASPPEGKFTYYLFNSSNIIKILLTGLIKRGENYFIKN